MQAIGGLVIGLIALYSSYDHITFGSTKHKLNRQWGVWLIASSLAVVAVDAQLASRSRRREEDRRIQDACAHESRMRAQQLRIEAEQIKNEADQIEAEQIKNEAEQIKNETEQLKRENAKLRQLNARGRELLSSAAQLYSAPECSSTPPTSSTEQD